MFLFEYIYNAVYVMSKLIFFIVLLANMCINSVNMNAHDLRQTWSYD